MNVLVNQHEYHTTLTIKNHFLKSISKRQLQKMKLLIFWTPIKILEQPTIVIFINSQAKQFSGMISRKDC